LPETKILRCFVRQDDVICSKQKKQTLKMVSLSNSVSDKLSLDFSKEEANSKRKINTN
jgi:hypothetical protein